MERKKIILLEEILASRGIFLTRSLKLLTSSEMRNLDREVIEKVGIPGVVLMENAGKRVADCIKEEEKVIYIFCGPGNNGGDGMVAGRWLFKKGKKVKIYLVGEKEKVKGEAKVNLEIIINMDIPFKEIKLKKDLPSLKELEEVDVIIDALLGTGSRGSPRGLIKKTIELINHSGKKVVAVDIPSGVDADTGEVWGEAVRADCTVTFAFPKRGLFLFPGMDYRGKVEVADIGFPPGMGGEIKCQILLPSELPFQGLRRKLSSHKGNFGHLLIVAGSEGMTGAAALVSMGALRVGAGLVTLACPEKLNFILEEKLTEVMTLPLPGTPEGTFSSLGIEKLENFSHRCSALCLGPGLRINEETKKLVKEILERFELPLVLDADGINCIEGEREILKNYRSSFVLTPHPGEAARFMGTSKEKVQKDRIKSALSIARDSGGVVVLKGACTVVAIPEGRVWVNVTGNPGMASGGSGDILAGMIGGFLSQGFPPRESALLGVFLHGLAGDLAVKIKGEVSLIPQDLLEELPYVFLGIEDIFKRKFKGESPLFEEINQGEGRK